MLGEARLGASPWECLRFKQRGWELERRLSHQASTDPLKIAALHLDHWDRSFALERNITSIKPQQMAVMTPSLSQDHQVSSLWSDTRRTLCIKKIEWILGSAAGNRLNPAVVWRKCGKHWVVKKNPLEQQACDIETTSLPPSVWGCKTT